MAKVIEQWFDGIKFRSKTEARWALFFKECGIRYEYEKEGYKLGGGSWYLPDFWLSDLGRWFEVKGATPSQREINKCHALACETQSEVLLAAGSPDPEAEQITRIYYTFDFFCADKHWRKYRDKNWRALSPTDEWEEGWQFADDALTEGIFWLDSSWFGAECIGPNKTLGAKQPPNIAGSATARGFNAVRRARFVNFEGEAQHT